MLTPSYIRQDLKCGKGAIPAGHRCTKGAATSVASKPSFRSRMQMDPGAKAAIIGGLGAGVVGAGLYASSYFPSMDRNNNNKQRVIKEFRNRVNESKSEAMRSAGISVLSAGIAGVAGGLAYQSHKNKDKLGTTMYGTLAAGTLGSSLNAAFATERHINSARKTVKEARRYRSATSAFRAFERDLRAKGWRKTENSSSGYTSWQRPGNAGSNDYANTYKKWQQRNKQHEEDFKRRYEEYQRKWNTGRSGAGSSSENSNTAYNPFNDLGVSNSASDAEIKAAWRRLMRQHHPDAGGDPETAKRINAAYQEILRRRRRGRRDAYHVDSVWACGFC